MSEATLYTGPTDYDSIVFRWLVNEKHAPINVVRLDSCSLHTAELPFLVDNDLNIFDHWVVLQYLQERYPGEVFMPVDPQIRAQIRQICMMLRDGDVTQREMQIVLSHRKPYMLGDDFTLADIYAGVRFDIYDNTDYDLLNRYIERLGRRINFQEAR